MRSPSTSEAGAIAATVADRDAELAGVVRSILDAAAATWGDRIIAEGHGFDPRQLYTETHYALAAVLLFLHDRRDRSLLDLAVSRLRLWATGAHPLTFFNAMAICLTAIVFRRSGTRHPALDGMLSSLLARTREHRSIALQQWCGNNAYLQQVAVDTVLLPAAREQDITEERLGLLLGEFRRFRTEEGLFFDLPRTTGQRERLLPPTYIMKMLFLLGICHEVHPAAEVERLFRTGMDAVLPLIARDGTFSYFGRTDNSPFASGLTIFDLRKAAELSPDRAAEFQRASARAEQFFATFPRTSSGVLRSNRFADSRSPGEDGYSRDAYAYAAQYSLSASAYALLAAHCFPAPTGADLPADEEHAAAVATSNDLGIVKLTGHGREIVVRTRSEMTSWDRRYLGPAILRYSTNGKLLVGAISRTVSTDRDVRQDRRAGSLRRLFDLFRDRYVDGAEHLDATSVGFLPVLRRGAVDYVPYTPASVDATPSRVVSRHPMLRVAARGAHPCFVEALQLLHGTVPGLKPKEYIAPLMRLTPSIELAREIVLKPAGCCIDDRISGDLRGTELLFSVRRLPGAAIRVDGMTRVRSMTGWGSDGRQVLDLYAARPSGSSISYRCEIAEES